MKIRILICFLVCVSILCDAHNITGNITDINSIPLEAVNISILDKKGGITSDKNGNYNISIKPNRS